SFIVDPLTATVLQRSHVSAFLIPEKGVRKLSEILSRETQLGTSVFLNEGSSSPPDDPEHPPLEPVDPDEPEEPDDPSFPDSPDDAPPDLPRP
ncbi:MAG: hypothetical protein AABY11_01445, partial [archaeon]